MSHDLWGMTLEHGLVHTFPQDLNKKLPDKVEVEMGLANRPVFTLEPKNTIHFLTWSLPP